MNACACMCACVTFVCVCVCVYVHVGVCCRSLSLLFSLACICSHGQSMAENNNQLTVVNPGYPLLAAELTNFMWAAGDAKTCLRREYCDPLRSHNVWGTMMEYNTSQEVIMVTAQVRLPCLLRVLVCLCACVLVCLCACVFPNLTLVLCTSHSHSPPPNDLTPSRFACVHLSSSELPLAAPPPQMDSLAFFHDQALGANADASGSQCSSHARRKRRRGRRGNKRG